MGEQGKIKSFTDLNAWQEGHKLVIMIYVLTKTFPDGETYGLVSQMQRCAVSITSNLAEGFSRQSYREKVQFYSISQGSVTELQNQLLVARDVGHVSQSQFEQLASQVITVHKLVSGLIKSSKSFVRP
ncbi:MAG: four helix bundle protein [Patescibacteria group bacterium]|jgi:four helix bundle protein